jgi:thiamine pyrophosphokinase
MQMIIVANGDITNDDIYLPSEAITIAANGGARHCLSLGIIPNVVIGDFDSLTNEELKTLNSFETKYIRYPSAKNETDLELALEYAVEHGVTEMYLLGLLGGRWDMSIANLLLLSTPKFEDIHFFILIGSDDLYILRGGMELWFQGKPGNPVSVIPLSYIASGISYQGLKWPLENEALKFGSHRGLSNYMIADNARIRLDSGVLLICIQRENCSITDYKNSKYAPI